MVDMIQIGTCGYSDYKPGGDWKERYKNKLQAFSHAFDAVELNRTFYELPQTKTAARWREEAREGFVFTVKAWQALTHPVKGVTWRKRAEKLTEAQKEQFGNLRPNDEVKAAWEQTREIAEALSAPVILLQTPASFDCTDAHEQNMRELLSSVNRNGVAVAWEPRGTWNENLDRVESICNDLGLIHAVDILRRAPVSQHSVAYVRLHGLNRRETDYNYTYSEDELGRLAEELRRLEASHDTVFCMFNNIGMYENAPALQKLLS
jgi:uncharacterized protein YecE (DUF72 family)